MVISEKPQKDGFETVFQNEAFKCAFISPSDQYAYGKVKLLKRHNDSDEVFVLLEGSAVLLTQDEGYAHQVTPLEKSTAYNVTKSTWHHLAVSDDALIFVAESGSMKPENTESINVESEEIYI